MWIKKKEWIEFLTSSNENRIRAEMLRDQLASRMDTIKQYAGALKAERTKATLLAARVSELENKILELNDALNIARKAAVPLASLNVAEMFDEEDPVRVSEMRERIRAEGADIVLAESVEK